MPAVDPGPWNGAQRKQTEKNFPSGKTEGKFFVSRAYCLAVTARLMAERMPRRGARLIL